MPSLASSPISTCGIMSLTHVKFSPSWRVCLSRLVITSAGRTFAIDLLEKLKWRKSSHFQICPVSKEGKKSSKYVWFPGGGKDKPINIIIVICFIEHYSDILLLFECHIFISNRGKNVSSFRTDIQLKVNC